jgi:diaminopimelate epimerase
LLERFGLLHGSYFDRFILTFNASAKLKPQAITADPFYRVSAATHSTYAIRLQLVNAAGTGPAVCGPCTMSRI